MSALEQSMRDICAKHDLLNIGITLHDQSHVSVSIQWADASEDDGRGCVFGRGETINECLGDAIRQKASKQVVALADVALEVL